MAAAAAHLTRPLGFVGFFFFFPLVSALRHLAGREICVGALMHFEIVHFLSFFAFMKCRRYLVENCPRTRGVKYVEQVCVTDSTTVYPNERPQERLTVQPAVEISKCREGR